MLQVTHTPDRIRTSAVANLAHLGPWQLELAHDNAEALLIWITRGQGLALIEGRRRGVGVHNAIYVPAGQLMALDLGRQGFGQVLVMPGSAGLSLPERVLHLRCRDVTAQSELTTLFDALGREQSTGRAMVQSAMSAYAGLALIWLRRHALADEADLPPDTAAARLMRSYCDLIVREHASGASMADLAARLGVTPTHLSRVCRAQTGRTAAALLTERLLHRARTMLQTSDLAMRDIARHLGFGSAAYFTRFIQTHTGKPPTALRRGTLRSA